MTAAPQDLCQAVNESNRRQIRCSQKAVGNFERTRRRYADEPGEGPVTIQLGRLCRRHANAFGARKVAS